MNVVQIGTEQRHIVWIFVRRNKLMEKRVFIPLWKALEDAHKMGYPEDFGFMACYDVENMGFCKDGKTRWYHFTSLDGVPAYTLKY